jgi:hypothetical protein
MVKENGEVVLCLKDDLEEEEGTITLVNHI